MEWGFSESYAVEAVFRGTAYVQPLRGKPAVLWQECFTGSFHNQGLAVHLLRYGKAHHIQNGGSDVRQTALTQF